VLNCSRTVIDGGERSQVWNKEQPKVTREEQLSCPTLEGEEATQKECSDGSIGEQSDDWLTIGFEENSNSDLDAQEGEVQERREEIDCLERKRGRRTKSIIDELRGDDGLKRWDNIREGEKLKEKLGSGCQGGQTEIPGKRDERPDKVLVGNSGEMDFSLIKKAPVRLKRGGSMRQQRGTGGVNQAKFLSRSRMGISAFPFQVYLNQRYPVRRRLISK